MKAKFEENYFVKISKNMGRILKTQTVICFPEVCVLVNSFGLACMFNLKQTKIEIFGQTEKQRLIDNFFNAIQWSWSETENLFSGLLTKCQYTLLTIKKGEPNRDRGLI